MIGNESTTSQEDDDEPLMEWEETPARRSRQPLVCLMHEWALTIRTEDEMEPLMMVEALDFVH